MNTRTPASLMQNNIVRIFLGTGVFLLFPLFGTVFVEGFNWGVEDYVAIGGLLIGTGLAYELGVKSLTKDSSYRAVGAVLLIFAALLAWVQMAVGIWD